MNSSISRLLFVCFVILPTVNGASTAFLQGQPSGATRNDYSGFAGMQFTVGASAMNVTALGRIYLAGNNQTHTVKLVNATTGLDVAGASVQLTMTPGDANTFEYASLSVPVQLAAGSSYYLVCQEMVGGDSWYDLTPVTSTSDGVVNFPVFAGSNGIYLPIGNIGLSSASFVPPNFQYALAAATPPPTVTVTQPAANAALTGNVTINASAAAAAGLTIANVRFELNGSPIGIPDSTYPYQATLNTTTYQDGSYNLSAIATDSYGTPSASYSLSVTFKNGNVPGGTPFVTSSTFMNPRNNSSDLLGMAFQVGSQPMTVNALGRMFSSGNSNTHLLKVVNASTGADVPGGSVQLNMTGGIAAQFKYESLPAPIVLQPGGSYYLVSQETIGGDQWYDYGPVTTTNMAQVMGPVFSTSTGYKLATNAGYSFVPVSFLYAATPAPPMSPPAVSVTSPTPGSTSGTVTFTAQATAASTLQIVSLQLLVDGVNFYSGATLTGQSWTVSYPLNTSTLSTGTHQLTAIAADSAGQTTTSAAVIISVNNSTAPTSTPLITGQALQGSVRSNFTGLLGMQFQVGSKPLVVTQLGRLCAPGDYQTHTIKLVQLSGIDVASASAAVSMASCTYGQYIYGPLSNSVTLAANTSYYLVSSEVNGGDPWYDLSPVTSTTAATVVQPIYSTNTGYFPVQYPGASYGPLNLQYSLGAPPTVSILTPAANTSLSGTVTLTANATALAAFSIASVQFQQNGVNIGSAVTGTGPTYSTQWDTTTLSNGSYNLTAIATDSSGNSTTSASVTVSLANSVAPNGAKSFITQQIFGTVRNDFSGFVGVQFGSGTSTLLVSHIGRICISGNQTTHTVKLVSGNGNDVPGASAAVNMQGCTGGTYVYTALATPITLSAGNTYFLVGQEASGGDQWYNFGPVSSSLTSPVNGPVYFGGGIYNFVYLPGNSYGPYNFLYTSGTASATPPVVSISSPAANAVLSGTVSVAANATAATGLAIASVQFQSNGTNIGTPKTGAGPTYSLSLDTTTLINGTYNLRAIATDSAGNTANSSSVSVTVSNGTAQPPSTTPSVTITSPSTGSTVTGTVSVTAVASPTPGTSISSLQLLIDGQNFGASCAASTCSATLDTTLLPNGKHALTASFAASDGTNTNSGPLPITVQNTVTGIGFLNGTQTYLVRNFDGWIGMSFTVGCTPLSITSLGRIYLPGNTGTHQLKLVSASSGADVPGGSASVSFTGAIANQIMYAPLAAPITLQPNTVYYLVSQETAGGDQFYDYMPVLTMGAATINGPAYMPSGSSWITPSAPNSVYVPVDFKFTVPGIPFPAAITSLAPGTPSTGSITPIVPAVYNHILIAGQSLATGTLGSPALTVTQPYTDLTLNAGNAALVPLIEGQGYGYSVGGDDETVGSSLGDIITRLSPGSSFTDIVTNAALGGAPYSALEKGTVAYAAGIAQLAAAKNLTLAASKSYKFSGVAVMHGETDQGLGASAATYENYLVQWQNNFQSDGQAISGQSDSVPFFIDQMNSWTYANLATPTVPLGQLQAALDYPSTIYMVGPKYQYHYSDGVHMDNVSYRQQGEQFGKVINHVLLGGVAWKAFVPKSITRSGNIVTVQFNVPAPPLQFDTSTVLPKSGMGFEYVDGSGCPPFIVSTQITSGDTITITLSATPTGTNEHLRYAFTGLAGARSGRDVSGSARGNLKDSDSTPSAYGNDLSNWAVAFDQLVTPSSAGK